MRGIILVRVWVAETACATGAERSPARVAGASDADGAGDADCGEPSGGNHARAARIEGGPAAGTADSVYRREQRKSVAVVGAACSNGRSDPRSRSPVGVRHQRGREKTLREIRKHGSGHVHAVHVARPRNSFRFFAAALLVACNIENDSEVCYQSACLEQLSDCRDPKLRNCARECARGRCAPETCAARG